MERKMTQSGFFQISMLIPFVVWVIGLLVFALFIRHGYDEMRWNFYHGYRITLPYLVFILVIWQIVRNKPFGFLMLMAFLVPILWGFFFTFWYAMAFFAQTGNVEDLFILSIMAFWAAFVGYLFEIVPMIFINIFRANLMSAEQQKEILRTVDASS